MAEMGAAILAFWLAHAEPFQATALLRHATVESNALADPPKRGTGHCVYQWAGRRWQDLQAYAGTAKCPALATQLEFALIELRSPTYRCFWHAKPGAAYTTLRRSFGHGARCR